MVLKNYRILYKNVLRIAFVESKKIKETVLVIDKVFSVVNNLKEVDSDL